MKLTIATSVLPLVAALLLPKPALAGVGIILGGHGIHAIVNPTVVVPAPEVVPAPYAVPEPYPVPPPYAAVPTPYPVPYRVWVRGHWDYTPDGRYWIPSHYEYRSSDY